MQRVLGVAMVMAAMSTPGEALAGGRTVLQPVQLDRESIRFDRGDYVADQASGRAAVQVRPALSDHGQLSFMIAVMNTGPAPINMDVANIRVDGTDQPVRLLTRTEMEQKAERRAGWAKFFTAVGGTLTAVGQANQRNYYSATTQTRFGTFSTEISAPCFQCQAAADQTVAATQARIAQIRNTLDNTREGLREQAFQITTVNPGQSYGGRIYLSKFRSRPLTPIRLVVTVGDEQFTFAFRLVPDGTPSPQYRMVMPAATIAPPTPVPFVSPSLTNSGLRFTPAAVPLPAFAHSTGRPVPSNLLPVVAAAPASTASPKWQRYYEALIGSGVSRSEARAMADEQFGGG